MISQILCLDMSATEITSAVATKTLGQWLCSAASAKAEEFFEDPENIEKFSTWMYTNVAPCNSKIQDVISMISNFALLETAEHVFSIGYGFAKVNTTSLKLAQILESVQKIEANVDAMLREPLNTAIDFFKSAMNEIENESFKDAYNSLDKVLDNATKALHFVSKKKIGVQCFQESVKAIQLLVFSRILRYSYDEKRDCFLPFATLPAKKIKLIGSALEELLKKSLNMTSNVKTSFFSKKEQQESIQNTVDQALKMCYSYISQAKGWTNLVTNISPYFVEFKITVMPLFVPEGKEDATNVMVGVKPGDDQPVSVLLWRTATHVCSIYGDIVSLKKISSLTVPMEIDIMNNSAVVVSSNGDAMMYHSSCHGQYYLLDEEKNIYEQIILKPDQTPNYIYFKSGRVDSWHIGPKIDSPSTDEIYHDECSRYDIPETGWKTWDGKDYRVDSSIEVTGGYIDTDVI